MVRQEPSRDIELSPEGVLGCSPRHSPEDFIQSKCYNFDVKKESSVAESFTRRRFPKYASHIRKLAQQHRQIKDEPLHLAVTYDPGRDRGDIFLFEVIENFGAGDIDPDQHLFEVVFGASNSLPLGAKDELHLVLTNPRELEVAINEDWKELKEIREAIQRGDYEVLWKDMVGKAIMEKLRG
jgi:hypothetical protein